jgi:hypothetical protein
MYMDATSVQLNFGLNNMLIGFILFHNFSTPKATHYGNAHQALTK